ncbi:MAG: hypothetical protein HUU16_00010 [Candidatus Omnitrophica bacterium]|nr:hypothetical protein [bacterium]NUN94532.1 hypothetical protein [Candidatus Omnitrophota bacterium]
MAGAGLEGGRVMEPLNEFTLRGRVIASELKPTTRGGRWNAVTLEATDDRVPIALFRFPPGGPLTVGEVVEVTGRLGMSDNGYLRLKVHEVRRLNDSPPGEWIEVGHGSRKQRAFVPGGPIPETDHFADDGSLPF